MATEFSSSRDQIASTLRNTKAVLERDKQLLNKALPFTRFEFVDVYFPQSNVAVKVPHNLLPDKPGDVAYLPVRKSVPTDIYHGFLGSPLDSLIDWTKNYIVLRSTTAPATVTLLLGVTRNEGIPSR